MELVVFAALHFELDARTAKSVADSSEPLQMLMEMVRTGQLVPQTDKSSTTDARFPSVTISPCMMRYLDRLSKPPQSDNQTAYSLKNINIELLTEYQERQSHTSDTSTSLATTMSLIRNEVMLNPNIHVHSLRSLARKHFINEKSLSRAFTKAFGTKISDFVQEQVMKRAYYLLENTDRSIADIAEELGYSNDYNFTRTFRSMYGVYPASLRKNSSPSATN